MGLVSGALVYVVAWWLVFFMTLPFGVKAQDEDGGDVVAGTHSSAPEKPMLLKKVFFSSIIAAVVWFALDWAIVNEMVNLKGN